MLIHGAPHWHDLHDTCCVAVALLDLAFYNACVKRDGGWAIGGNGVSVWGYSKLEAQKLRDRFAREGPGSLTEQQRTALETALACDVLWPEKQTQNVMEVCGLPTSRDALVEFIKSDRNIERNNFPSG
jgi:hypothetical protein